MKFFLAASTGVMEAEAEEGFTFDQCDKDNNGCLNWDEVEKCIEEYGPILPDIGIPLPEKEDFDDMAGEDGCLTFEEWEEAFEGSEESDEEEVPEATSDN